MGNRSTSSNLVFCAKNTKLVISIFVFFTVILDELRGWEPFCGSKTLCLTEINLRYSLRQRTTLITLERGAPLKARISSSAPKKRMSIGHPFFCLQRRVERNRESSGLSARTALTLCVNTSSSALLVESPCALGLVRKLRYNSIPIKYSKPK